MALGRTLPQSADFITWTQISSTCQVSLKTPCWVLVFLDWLPSLFCWQGFHSCDSESLVNLDVNANLIVKADCCSYLSILMVFDLHLQKPHFYYLPPCVLQVLNLAFTLVSQPQINLAQSYCASAFSSLCAKAHMLKPQVSVLEMHSILSSKFETNFSEQQSFLCIQGFQITFTISPYKHAQC